MITVYPQTMLTAKIVCYILKENSSLIPVFRRAINVLGEDTIYSLLCLSLLYFIHNTFPRKDTGGRRTFGGQFIRLLKLNEQSNFIFKNVN